MEYRTPAPTINDRYADSRATQTNPVAAAAPTTVSGRVSASAKGSRVIYLGRANREGMFVRAERSLNPQHSVFRLETSDNVSGIYTVVEDPEVEARILANPDLLLAGSCELEDPDTYGKEAVATENPGTAIFEGGRWRVLRPALVRFV